jgi:hypothetical protein
MKKIKLVFWIALVAVSCRRPSEELHNFEIAGQCLLPGYSRDLDIKDDYAYIANDQGGMQIVDISDPLAPNVAGEYFSQVNVQGIAVRDSFAYLALAAGPPNNGGLVMVNINDPSKPVFVSQDNWFYAYNVSAPPMPSDTDTQFVYIAGRYWFIVEDVTWPQYPSYARRFATPGNVRDLDVVDSLVFLAAEQVGLLIYNLHHPDSTVLVGEMDTPSNARSVSISDGYAYVADGNDGLIIIDVSDPENPSLAGQYDTPGYAQGICVQGGLAYIADGSEGLQIIDVSDPANPKLYGRLKTNYAYNVKYHDGIYLVDRDQGLLIISEIEL